MKRSLELAKRRQDAYLKQKEEEDKLKKQKDLIILEQKKEVIRKETRLLINQNTGPTMNCPDCGELRQRGGGLVSHRTTYCENLQF